jgi:hypothetical protein
MKRVIAVLLLLIMISGCGSGGSIERGLVLREKLLNSNGCSFDSVITADYGEKVYTFSMHCQADKNGDLSFSVTEPDSISGITGVIRNAGGALTFDGKVLAFEMLADGQVTPVSAPWLLVKSLRGGYFASCGTWDGGLVLGVDDSYEDNALHLDIWLDSNDLPIRSEILWQGRRVVSLAVRNFSYL